MITKNVKIKGHRTSLRLEQAIWDAVDDICRREDITVHQLFTLIDNRRQGNNRTSAVRCFVVDYLLNFVPKNGVLRKDTAFSILSDKTSVRLTA